MEHQIITQNVYAPDTEAKLDVARKLFAQFDSNKNGTLDPSEVAGLIKTTFENMGVKDYSVTADDVKLYMKSVDVDNNGLVSYSEYEEYVIACLKKAGFDCEVKQKVKRSAKKRDAATEMKLDVARRLFAKYDSDKSGQLEEKEVYGVITETYKQMGMDYKPTEADVKLWMSMTDTDKNGTVSIVEYEDFVISGLKKAGFMVKEFTQA
uniref:23 kDa calcium-binding protein n=1 Tax=Tetrahymena thermophila TaxID=5911 RepID=CB23_TETTH|nr:RecName: Full=23 kDa calcium-binding protein; AltName: Full=TCBP-23; Contains: RecName: Full=12 kDa calcium-binding protein; AltName: Full=TCBP-12 [Tetrahymena thermophila]AAA30129.1 calcium-binding protein (TCBP-23) [Tetrahymena thermophila]